MSEMQEGRMKKAKLMLIAGAALFGSSSVAISQDYNDQYQGNQDNRSVEQRGLDALGQFLGTGNNNAPAYREVSPEDIVRDLEHQNFHRISDPIRRGNTYLVYAIDPRGEDVELTIDADSGRIVDRRRRG
jgi:hypothetical protein